MTLISDCCVGLQNLEIRNAWLSIEGLKPMMKLISLTLEFIRLDDEDLDMVNECFPSLKVLKLIGVGGLRDPKIVLSHLRVFRWSVSNFPLSLTIDAPNLVELKLECFEPKVLVLKTPLLSDLSLTIKTPTGIIQLGSFLNLESLKIESYDLYRLVQVFTVSRSVKKLELESQVSVGSDELFDTVTFGDIVRAFPNMGDLKFGPGASTELEKSFTHGGVNFAYECSNLKKLTVYLPLSKPDTMFVSSVLNMSAQLREVVILIHADESADTRGLIFSNFKCKFPKITWKWGIWKESSDDILLDY